MKIEKRGFPLVLALLISIISFSLILSIEQGKKVDNQLKERVQQND